LVLCQAPSTNPSGTGACAATYTCVPLNGVCGNSTVADPKKYCGSSTNFCEYAVSGKCLARYATGQPCNASVYFGLDCQSFSCSGTPNVCQAPPTFTTTPAPTVTYAYEGDACSGSTPCAAGLSCVTAVCQKYFASAVGSACVTALDCAPGSVCVASLCAAQTSTKVIGDTCSGDSDCNSQTALNAVCVCNAVAATTGTCGVLDPLNGPAFTTAAVSSCTALYNQYKNMAKITASNTVAAGTNFGCVLSCAYTHGPSTVTAAWAGYNKVVLLSATSGTINNCAYTAPTTCANPTTTGPTTKGSASAVVASLFLTIFAFLF